MVIEYNVEVGKKYRFEIDGIKEVVEIIEPPRKNASGFLEYKAKNESGDEIIVFNDELHEL